MPPTVLLLEGRADLRSLEELILVDLGTRVETVPSGADPVDCAARDQPNLVVVHLGIREPYHEVLLDRLHRDPRTRAIPVVVIVASEKRAAGAKASPNVPATVVAPYDTRALEHAVRAALNHGVPTAAIPPTGRAVPEADRSAASRIDQNARAIALKTLEQLLATEPYHTRFAGLTPSLAEDVGSLVARIADGLKGGLSASELWDNPGARTMLDRHVRIREEQGFGIDAVEIEPVLLRGQIDRFLAGLVGKNGFSEADARDVARQCGVYLQEYARRLAAAYRGR